jgi:fucose permease
LAGNVLAAEASSGAGPLNLVNAMFGVGAIVSPALVGASLMAWKTGLPALWVSPVAAAACAVLLLPQLARGGRHRKPPVDAPQGGGIAALLSSGLVWATGLLLLCDVSIEICISTWLPKILESAMDVPLAYGAMAVSWFWLQVTIVRFVAAGISRRVSSRAMLRVCAGLCCLGAAAIVVAVAASDVFVAAAAVTLLGFGIGPVFPTVISVLRSAVPQDAGLATAVAAGTGNVGGALMPFLLGYLLAQEGALLASTLILAVAAALAILLAAVEGLSRRRQRTTRRQSIGPPRGDFNALRQLPSAN